jgi:hypothetical protein
MYVLGNGDDVLKDSWGDDVVNPGGGDDIIDLGWGNDIVVLESGWGDDIVSKTCHDSTLSDADRARLGWQHRYNSFVVFGPGIHPADIHWESKTVLTHPPSKSRLTLKAECFNLVFTEEGELQPFTPPAPPAAKQVTLPSPAEQAAARQQAREKIVQALSAAPQGDVIVEIDPATFEGFERQASSNHAMASPVLCGATGKSCWCFTPTAAAASSRSGRRVHSGNDRGTYPPLKIRFTAPLALLKSSLPA